MHMQSDMHAHMWPGAGAACRCAYRDATHTHAYICGQVPVLRVDVQLQTLTTHKISPGGDYLAGFQGPGLHKQILGNVVLRMQRLADINAGTMEVPLLHCLGFLHRVVSTYVHSC